MTSAVISPIEPQSMEHNGGPADGQPPRKRRRRTAAGGATDDCFTCRSRAVQCDRKRPYCTQCIEIGKECAGYKTTLTWGVGVASRGKLRGLSCPVANKNVDGTDVSPSELEDRRRRKSSVAKPKKEEASDAVTTNAVDTKPPRLTTSVIAAQNAAHTYPPPSIPQSQAQAHDGWQPSGFQNHLEAREARDVTFSQPRLQHLQIPVGTHYDNAGVPNSGRSVGSYADTEFYSPMEYPHTPNSLPFPEQIPPPNSEPFLEQQVVVPSTDRFNMNSSINAVQDPPTLVGNGNVESHQTGFGAFDSALFGLGDTVLAPATNSSFHFPSPLNDSEEAVDDSDKQLSFLDTRFSSTFFHISPRLQSLMEYYNQNICPYLVAFDGPENPYRKHILQLAMGNTGLQNAIAALSTNNFRMRRMPQRQIGFVEELTDAFHGTASTDYNEPTPEESSYKQMSINSLNLQLTDVRAAQDDSVLATLLILCLFHVCDSGFSKFKTQLAGVQKLLSFRDPNTQSDFTRWVEMFFTWFDVMTSTVNDREMQVKGDSMAMLDFSAGLGAMEQFSGCDGRLFKLVARLGRLNLLAQGRPVKSSNNAEQTPQPIPIQRPAVRAMRRKKPNAKARVNKSLSVADYDNIDGNGWGTPIISSDEDADGSEDEEFIGFDERHDFWREWLDIRTRLQSWQMNVTSIPSATSPNIPNNPVELEAGQRDLIHINESFRYAALLYTERLGHPLVPSSHTQFQDLVREALYHITALPVESCVTKFLLWPLFITGTECVDENHRNFIRSRCQSIQEESGFFNNISSLELLEKVWADVGINAHRSEDEEVRARRRDSEASRSGRYGQAFRWRKAMDRVDGEYIVI